MASSRKTTKHHVARKPNAADRYIGQRVRQARHELGLTQEVVAELLGVTFQQVQKYESGTSRLTAGRLRDIAIALHKPIDFFFEPFDLKQVARTKSATDVHRRTLQRDLKRLVDMIRDIESLEALKSVTRAFCAAES